MFERLVRMNCFSKIKFMRKIAREFLEKLYGCEINCAQIDPNVRFAHHARGCTIVAAKICENVVIFQNVSIGSNLRFNKSSSEWENIGNPIISKNVIICDGAKILGPVVIEENSIIAAGAVITKNIPAHHIGYGFNQCRAKNSDYDWVFRADMINSEHIIERNRMLIEEFEAN